MSNPDHIPAVLDANALEAMARERPDDKFLKGSGVLKLTGAIRTLEREVRELREAAAMAATVQLSYEMTDGAGAPTLQEEIESVVACLGDDAAALRDETGNPEDERAANMDAAAELIERLAAQAPVAGQPAEPSPAGHLYLALNNLLTHIGLEGSIDADHGFVWDTMTALKRIDGGVYLDNLAVPTEPDAHRDDMLAAVRMLEDGEWAEHFAKTPIGKRLEDAITKLHSDLNDAQPSEPSPMVGEMELIEKAALRVGISSLLNHGAASCVYSEGCCGVTQAHLLAYTREIALHCAAALAAPKGDSNG